MWHRNGKFTPKMKPWSWYGHKTTAWCQGLKEFSWIFAYKERSRLQQRRQNSVPWPVLQGKTLSFTAQIEYIQDGKASLRGFSTGWRQEGEERLINSSKRDYEGLEVFHIGNRDWQTLWGVWETLEGMQYRKHR